MTFAIGAFAAIEACNASTSNQSVLEEPEITASILLEEPEITASIPATIHIGEPQAGLTAVAFASRFDCSQAELISPMATAAYQAPLRKNRDYSFATESFVGAASTYNPHDAADRDAGQAQTASGEFYDANDWTAAVHIELRWQFGGVRYGKNYVPTYALIESGDRRVIVRINDVGPLKPGRIVDLNDQTMRYFDPTMQLGLLRDVKVTPLTGDDIALGPVEPEQTRMAGDFDQPASAPDFLRDLDNHAQLGPLLFLR